MPVLPPRVFEDRLRLPTSEQRQVFRARVVPFAAETRSIAREPGAMLRRVSGGRGRFECEGLAWKTGRIVDLHQSTGAEPAGVFWPCWTNPPPKAYARSTGPSIAEALGNVHEPQVWRFRRPHKIDLVGCRSWWESTDPEFVAKAADVVGLYMAPPENALVFCVGERPSIQAPLERAQGYLKGPNGQTLTGRSHGYNHDASPFVWTKQESAPLQGRRISEL